MNNQGGVADNETVELYCKLHKPTPASASPIHARYLKLYTIALYAKRDQINVSSIHGL